MNIFKWFCKHEYVKIHDCPTIEIKATPIKSSTKTQKVVILMCEKCGKVIIKTERWKDYEHI